MCLLIVVCVTGCKTEKIEKVPEVTQIRAICNLATLETYYHNVAKLEKGRGGGILSSLFQKDRELWIEYTGVARIGIDMSLVDMKIEGNEVTITLPAAKLLSIDVGEISKDSYYRSADNKLFFKNKITPEEETEAINAAQNAMKESVEVNTQLLMNAQDRASQLIEKYIKELGNLSGIDYKINWIYE